MEKKLRILFVEDSIDDVVLIEHLLKKEGYFFTSIAVETKEDFEKQLLQFQPDVVISDHTLPQFNSIEALKIFKNYKKNINRFVAFILVTGTVSEEFAVKAIQSGVDDYILKDRLIRLPSAINNAIEKNRLKKERKKAEEEKLQLLHIFQKSQVELFVFDPHTLLIDYVNQKALDNLGYIRNEVLKMSILDFLHEFNEVFFKELLDSARSSKKGRIFETYGIRKNGSKYPIQVHIQMINQEGRNTFLANVLDITEAKEIEQQKELALFIQNCFNEKRTLKTSLGMILQELCTRSAISTAELWARDFEGEAIKRYAIWDTVNEDPGNSGLYLAQKAMETGKSYNIDLRKKKIPHKWKHLIQSRFESAGAFPLKFGNEISAIIVMYDSKFIEERNPFINLKEGIQEKIIENIRRKKIEKELQKIFELSPDILVIFGKDGYVRKINPAFQKLLGYSNVKIFSRTYGELIHPEDVHMLEELRDLHLDENEVANFESRWRAKDGNYRCFSWSVTLFLPSELYFAIGRDITEYKANMNAIQSQNEKLAEIAWEQSHIVRAPLTRLMACVSYLQDEPMNSSEILKSIETSAHEIDNILKSIVSKTQSVRQHGKY